MLLLTQSVSPTEQWWYKSCGFLLFHHECGRLVNPHHWYCCIAITSGQTRPFSAHAPRRQNKQCFFFLSSHFPLLFLSFIIIPVRDTIPACTTSGKPYTGNDKKRWEGMMRERRRRREDFRFCVVARNSKLEFRSILTVTMDNVSIFVPYWPLTRITSKFSFHFDRYQG